MRLSSVEEKFVLHWGEMGTRWGVNRTVAQIHALLFLSSRPLPADEICETLGVARSNVSNSLKELQGWGLARMAHVMGDRRDHFETSKDVWALFLTIVEERKKREFDPTLTMLRACLDELAQVPSAATDGLSAPEATLRPAPETQARIESVLVLMETLTVWMQEMKRLPPETLMGILKLGAKVQKMLGRTD